MTMDSLLRALPIFPDIYEKLQTGEYTLHGGVVRHAAGSSKGGQIVGHLRFPSDAGQAQQQIHELQSLLQKGLGSLQSGMDQLQQSMNVLQRLQSANLVMSGLNLAVSTAGFIIVCKKLDKLSDQIERQSQGIEQLVSMAEEARERSLLSDEASFRALVLSAQQYAENHDTEHLKMLIPEFHRQYQFSRMVLQKHAPMPESSILRFDEVSLVQERLIHLGLLMSHVQVQLGQPERAGVCLTQLSTDVQWLNGTRVEALTSREDIAFQMPQEHMPNLISFLNRGKQTLPALSYQADLLALENQHPNTLLALAENDQIMLLAA